VKIRHLVGAVVLAGIAAPGFAQAVHAIRVPYVAMAPVIDGVLDKSLASLPSHVLPRQSSTSDASAVQAPSYRIGYGADFLYVFVEIDTPQLAQRDRAYQNGDGVVLVIARPQPANAPTDEFYVLGFSPGTPAARWQQRFVWYRNVDLEMRTLDDTVVATSSSGGRSFFEILVPWREVYPYHPWLSDAIGFNVCVTRALPGTASARYCAVEDHKVDSEQNPRRYDRLSFEPARPGSTLQAFAVLDRNHVVQGTAPKLRLATLAPAPAFVPVTTRVVSGEGSRLAVRQVMLDVAPGVTVHEVDVPAAAQPPGGYAVTWDAGNGAASGRLGLSVLPPADPAALTARLDRVRDRLRPGSYTTLQFQIEEIDRQQRALHPYDTSAALRASIDQFLGDLHDAESGPDPVAARRGIFRRAFRSAIDHQLQPYSVKIPADYRPDGRYPLLVFLHGSGQDDRNELTRDWLPSGFILLAPRARGTSNWYNSDHAQDDIREAVEDVVSNYAVDGSRIILAGFSMGGYGVYRTYKEDPSRYRALAIFSGIPRIPGGAGDGPDFLEKEDLSMFARPPMFVFHGGKDRNCPIEQTRALVARLKQAGANVQFEFEEDKGHEAAGATTLRAFQEWVRRVIDQSL
jgi:predicted esterase